FARSLLDPDTFDLFAVDPTTAAVTRLGTSADGTGVYTGGMAFRDDGTLFASIDNLITTLDPTTGAPTPLAGFFGGQYPGGLAFDGGRLLEASYSPTLYEIDQV